MSNLGVIFKETESETQLTPLLCRWGCGTGTALQERKADAPIDANLSSYEEVKESVQYEASVQTQGSVYF